MFDITNMALFARVVKCGSFSEAARQLGMPKSTLSRRINELEQQQGVRLLHRTTRQLKLTDVGRAFLVHCQTIADAAQAAQRVTQQVQEVPRGRVRVSCPHAISQSLLTDLIPLFLLQYPQVELDLVVTNSPVDLLRDNIDIALRVRPSIEDSSLIARALGSSPSVLVAAPSFIQKSLQSRRKSAFSHPAELVDLASLSLHFSSGRYQLQLQHQQTAEQLSIAIQPRVITDDMGVLRASAVAGLGMVSLPTYLVNDDINAGRLQPLLPEWRLPLGVMHLVYPYRRGLLPAIRALVDFLVAELPTQGGLYGLVD